VRAGGALSGGPTALSGSDWTAIVLWGLGTAKCRVERRVTPGNRLGCVSEIRCGLVSRYFWSAKSGPFTGSCRLKQRGCWAPMLLRVEATKTFDRTQKHTARPVPHHPHTVIAADRI